MFTVFFDFTISSDIQLLQGEKRVKTGQNLLIDDLYVTNVKILFNLLNNSKWRFQNFSVISFEIQKTNFKSDIY